MLGFSAIAIFRFAVVLLIILSVFGIITAFNINIWGLFGLQNPFAILNQFSPQNVFSEWVQAL